MSKGQSRSSIKWIIAVGAFLLLAILVGLGVWQLQRAEQKAELLRQWELQAEHLTVLPALPAKTGVRMRLSGELDSKRWFLLDNRVRDGQVGYDVLALFQTTGEARPLLVDLGWIGADIDRSIFPDVRLPVGKHDIQGRLIYPQNGLQLSPDQWGAGWPKRIQQVDMQRIQSAIGQGLYPAVLRPTEPVIPALKIGWKLVNMPPEKHLGYALQWFLLALILAGGIGWLGWQNYQAPPNEEQT